MPTAEGKVGLVHFDAHADTGKSTRGNLASHATPMRRLIESGAIPGRNFVQIGLRGYWPEPKTFERMRAQGMRWHLMGELLDRGVETVIDEAIHQALDGPEFTVGRHRRARSGVCTGHGDARARRDAAFRPPGGDPEDRATDGIGRNDVVEVSPP